MSIQYEHPEHPGFAPEVGALLSEGCYDASWHNDESPSVEQEFKIGGASFYLRVWDLYPVSFYPPSDADRPFHFVVSLNYDDMNVDLGLGSLWDGEEFATAREAVARFVEVSALLTRKAVA